MKKNIKIYETVENGEYKEVKEHVFPFEIVAKYAKENGYESVEEFLEEYTSDDTIELISEQLRV